MRIISGKFGGRRLEVPKNQYIRPTSDKIRGSIFNALNARIDFENIIALDLCCGTGALGLETLSRGSKHCIFIDKSKESIDLAKSNAKNLSTYDQCTFIKQSCTHIGTNSEDKYKIDVFFCDPPYNKGLIPLALEQLIQGNWLENQAIGVLESEKSWNFESHINYEVLDEKIYGDTKITYIQALTQS